MKVSVFNQGMMERLHRNCCRIVLVQAALGLSIQMEKISSITYADVQLAIRMRHAIAYYWSKRLIVCKEYACMIGHRRSEIYECRKHESCVSAKGEQN